MTSQRLSTEVKDRLLLHCSQMCYFGFIFLKQFLPFMTNDRFTVQHFQHTSGADNKMYFSTPKVFTYRIGDTDNART